MAAPKKSAKNVTKTLKRNETTVPEQQLDLLYRVPFSKATRIVGLAYRQQHLYIGTIESRIHVLKAENGEQVQEITLGESAEGMTISSNGNIVIIHGTRIRSFNNGRNVYELELNVPASFITAVGNKVMVLSKNGAQVYVLTDKLEIIRRINVQTDGQNACNFITASDRSVFVSCDKAILQLSKDGRMIRWIGAAENSTYSLGIELDDKQRLLAIKQGQPRIRVFMDGKPIEELYSGRTPSIWSGILYRAGRLHVLDYVANSLLTFQYPTNLL